MEYGGKGQLVKGSRVELGHACYLKLHKIILILPMFGKMQKRLRNAFIYVFSTKQ